MYRNHFASRVLQVISGGVAIFGLSGLVACATQTSQIDPQIEQFVADKPSELQPNYRQLVTDGPRNSVLHNMHICLKAMEIGTDELAEAACDDALRGIETVYAQTDSAEKARSLWHEEGEKDFKGEPYERAMAYYYRGLLYLLENDYDNARASFRGGLIQDSMAAQEEYAQDFALLSYLSGWASQCGGNAALAHESYAEVTARHAGFAQPAAHANLLVVAETGRGPVKFATGQSDEELRFRPGDETPDRAVRIQVGAESVDAFPVEDLYFQASTRGGRPIDAILEGKARFKDQVGTAGDVATQVGLSTMLAGAAYQSPEAQLVGAGIALVGIATRAVSAAMKPGADTRMWNSLPSQVHVAALQVPAGPVDVATHFVDAEGIEVLSQAGPVELGSQSCTLVWLRSGAAEGSVAARRGLGTTVAQLGH